MHAVLRYTKTYKFAGVRAPSMHPWLISKVQSLVLVIMLFALVQPVLAQELKPDLSFEDYKQIIQLADRVEAAVLVPDALLLAEITRPRQGLFLDLFSDTQDGNIVYVPYIRLPEMFTDFADKYWGGNDSADFNWYADIPSVLLGVWGGSVLLKAQYPDQGKDRWTRIVSLAQAFARFDSKLIDELSAEPINHRFVYENEHFVQYFVQSPFSEVGGDYWFLIVDKDEHGWFLKGITHMDRWTT
jgi:hypothetical protein